MALGFLLLCCRCCQALVHGFFLPSCWALHHMAPIGLVASSGVGATRLPRPALRAGVNTRHAMLSAEAVCWPGSFLLQGFQVPVLRGWRCSSASTEGTLPTRHT
jgi:hypothetical protein